jgi:hypothetical protein
MHKLEFVQHLNHEHFRKFLRDLTLCRLNWQLPSKRRALSSQYGESVHQIRSEMKAAEGALEVSRRANRSSLIERN